MPSNTWKVFEDLLQSGLPICGAVQPLLVLNVFRSFSVLNTHPFADLNALSADRRRERMSYGERSEASGYSTIT